MGAVTVANVSPSGNSPWNTGRTLVLAKVTWSGSYATGGDTLDETLLGLRSVYKVWVAGDLDPYLTNGPVAPTQMAGGSYEVRLGGTSANDPRLILRKGGTTPVEETAATVVSGVNAWLLFEGNV